MNTPARHPASGKQLTIHGPGDARWEEGPLQPPSPDEVLLRVEGITTCPHWDMHMMDGKPMLPGLPLSYPLPPGKPGHEAVGRVIACGEDVQQLKTGDRVVAWQDTGEPLRPGFYAQFVCFPEKSLLKVAENVPVGQLAPLELAMCVEVSFQQLEALGVLKDARIGLTGMGPAGLVAVQLAKLHGAREVIAFEPETTRHPTALSLGADVCLDPSSEKWPASRRAPEALDCAIDLTGVPAAIEFLMDRTRRAVALFGVLRQEVRFASRHLFGPGLYLLGYGSHHRGAAEAVLPWISEGKLQLEPLISLRLPFSRYAEGVEALRQKKAIKVLWDPWLE